MINGVRSNQEMEDLMANLRKQSEIYGEAYELNYVDTEGEFSVTILNPTEAYYYTFLDRTLSNIVAIRSWVPGLHTTCKGWTCIN
nr:phage portal protein [Desulfosporosinus fructosivorans]